MKQAVGSERQTRGSHSGRHWPRPGGLALPRSRSDECVMESGHGSNGQEEGHP